MAMEVDIPSKRLVKHALPIMIIAVALSVLPAITFGRFNGFNTESVLAKGLVTRAIHFQPAPNSLASAGQYDDRDVTDYNAGSNLSGGLARTGLTAQLSINLQLSPEGR